MTPRFFTRLSMLLPWSQTNNFIRSPVLMTASRASKSKLSEHPMLAWPVGKNIPYGLFPRVADPWEEKKSVLQSHSAGYATDKVNDGKDDLVAQLPQDFIAPNAKKKECQLKMKHGGFKQDLYLKGEYGLQLWMHVKKMIKWNNMISSRIAR